MSSRKTLQTWYFGLISSSFAFAITHAITHAIAHAIKLCIFVLMQILIEMLASFVVQNQSLLLKTLLCNFSILFSILQVRRCEDEWTLHSCVLWFISAPPCNHIGQVHPHQHKWDELTPHLSFAAQLIYYHHLMVVRWTMSASIWKRPQTRRFMAKFVQWPADTADRTAV